MITGIVEIKDFLSDPDEIVRLAKLCSFYSLSEHPKTLNPNERRLNWSGMRSDSIYKFDKPLSDKLFDCLFCKIADKASGNLAYSMEYRYNGDLSFHYLTGQDVYNDSWVHNDNGSVFAGVLYLNKDVAEDVGTVVFVDGKPIEIKNEYNKLVLYPAHFMHHAQSGFGKDVNDARLSIVFFVSSVEFRLSCG